MRSVRAFQIIPQQMTKTCHNQYHLNQVHNILEYQPLRQLAFDNLFFHLMTQQLVIDVATDWCFIHSKGLHSCLHSDHKVNTITWDNDKSEATHGHPPHDKSQILSLSSKFTSCPVFSREFYVVSHWIKNKYFTSKEVFLMLSLRKVADASEISQKNGYLTLLKTFLKPL